MDKTVLIEEACRELLTYGVRDGKEKLKVLVKRYLMRRRTAPEDMVFWPTGLLSAGLWQCRQEMKEKDGGEPESVRISVSMIELVLDAYFDRWFRKGCPVTCMDDLLSGETFLEIYEAYRERPQETQDKGSVDVRNAEQYRQAIEKLAAYALCYPTDETGSFPYRAQWSMGDIFVDSIGLTCPFLYRYGVLYDRQETMELAVKQIANFLSYGMDVATGLPYHGYSIEDDCKYGIIGWGRAVGWLLRGMSGCITTEYGAGRLAEPYRKLIDTALGFQRRDGDFSWQLQAMEGPADTSATGMICASLKRGIELGVLTGEQYEEAVEAGRTAIEKSVRDGRVYHCSAECDGFGQYPQRYGAYPWALGPALML